MGKLESRPQPPVRRDVELEQRSLYLPGSQTETCRWSGEDEGEFSKQIDPERAKPVSSLFRIVRELYGDGFADRKLRSEGVSSNIVWGKVGIIHRYAGLFTGYYQPTPRDLKFLTNKLAETISNVMKQLPDLHFSEQEEATNQIIMVANELVNAATAFRDGLRYGGTENNDDRYQRRETGY